MRQPSRLFRALCLLFHTGTHDWRTNCVRQAGDGRIAGISQRRDLPVCRFEGCVTVAAVTEIHAAADHREGQVETAVGAGVALIAAELRGWIDLLGFGWQTRTHVEIAD